MGICEWDSGSTDWYIVFKMASIQKTLNIISNVSLNMQGLEEDLCTKIGKIVVCMEKILFIS